MEADDKKEYESIMKNDTTRGLSSRAPECETRQISLGCVPQPHENGLP
jgi:hypothetical protein